MHAVVALVTAPASEAGHIARALLGDKLVACVNVLPSVQSFYWWDGELQHDEESLLIIKTTADQIAAIDAKLDGMHPYEVYELVVMEVTAGNANYLSWIDAAIAKESASEMT